MELNYKSFFVGLLLVLGVAGVTSAQKTVTGTVTSGADGEPLIGATVLVKGTSTGTATDVDGTYSLAVPGNDAVLVYSYTGFTSKEITVGDQTVINVTLDEGSTLTEVVVTGYTAQSRRDITGSVAVIDTREMKKLASSNFAEQLQGKVAGVQIGTSGDPGAASFVRIRGYGTINNNEPLYVIDGVPVQNESNLNFLNPNDIESMQVLKDASAASIYGSRAANGVIIITTRKGKVGNSKIAVDWFYGTQSPTKYPELLNPAELLELNQKLDQGAGIPFSSSLYIQEGDKWVLPDFVYRGGGSSGGAKSGDPRVDPSRYFLTPDPTANADVNYLIQKTNKEGTDWFREMFNSAPVANYQVSAQGGSDKGNYFLSGNYYNHQGMMFRNDYERYQARANTQFNVKKNFRIGNHLNFAYQTGHGGIGNPNEGSPLMNAYRMPQLAPVYDINGYFGGAYGMNSNASNPVADQERNFVNNSHSARLFGDIYAEVDLLKGLTAKTLFGMDYNTGRGKYYGFRNFNNTEVNSANSLEENQFTNENWIWYNTLRYSFDVGDNIHLDLLGGTEAKNNHYIGFNARGSKLEFGDDQYYRVLGNVAGGTYGLGSYEGSTSKFSLIGSANASIMDKYLLAFTIRRDGSSKFLNNRYGVFPGFSVGWRISNESFMEGVDAITDLKLRAGYGITGNDEASGDFPGFSNFGTSIGGTSYDITGSGNSVVPGFDQNSIGNPDLKWETTKMLNLGFDLTLFSKLDLVFEWYNKKTTDMIYPLQLPTTAGQVGSLNVNIGDMKNTGVDLQLNYRGSAGKLTYTVGLTGSVYKNEVITLDANENTFVRSGGSRIDNLTITQAGYPLSQFYGYIVDGLWASQAEIDATLRTNPGNAKPGRFKFRDINGDGQINNLDETTIGSPHPDFLLGANFSANYNNFDFTLFLQGVFGNELLNYVKYFTHTPAFQANYAREMLTEAGQSLPVLDRNDNYSNQRSSFYVEDGSYLRARNIQIGYTLPNRLLSKAGIDRLRAYVQGQNLLTFTNYSGLDPDVTVDNIQQGFVQQRDYALGIDRGRYPTAATVLFGINLEF